MSNSNNNNNSYHHHPSVVSSLSTEQLNHVILEAHIGEKDATLLLNNLQNFYPQELFIKCAELLSLYHQEERVVFYCLSFFQNLLGRKHEPSPETRGQIRRILLQYIQNSANNQDNNNGSICLPSYIKTKATVILAKCIHWDYPAYWAEPFQELIFSHQVIVDTEIKFRLLDALSDEVLMFDASRTAEEVARNCEIKSLLYSSNDNNSISLLKQLVQYIVMCLQQYYSFQNNNSTICNEQMRALALVTLRHFLCLKELELQAHDETIQLIIKYCLCSDSICAKNAVCCLLEIVGRDDPHNKYKLWLDMKLFEVLHSIDINGRIDLALKVAETVGSAGVDLLDMVKDFTDESVGCVKSLLPSLFPIFWKCMMHYDLDVVLAIIPLAQRVVVLAESKSSNKNNVFREHLSTLLNALYQQMKYPSDEYDFDDDDSSEDELFRIQLRNLYQKISRVDSDLTLQFLCSALANLPMPLSTAPFKDLEVSMRLVYHFGEKLDPKLRSSFLQHGQQFYQVLSALYQSDVASHSHPEVLLLYYDIVVRYAKILKVNTDLLLPIVLSNITSDKGIFHSDRKVRSRSCYLLLKLVKDLVTVLRPYVETAVQGIQGLLLNKTLHIEPSDSLHLFETMCILVGGTGIEESVQESYLHTILQPHIQYMYETLNNTRKQDGPNYISSASEILGNAIAGVAYLLKGFNKPYPAVQHQFLLTLPTLLTILRTLPEENVVRAKTMIVLNRMIISLKHLVLEHLSPFLSILIENADVEDINDVTQLLNQICTKFKMDAVPTIDESLIPFMQKCYSLIPNEEFGQSEVAPHVLTEQLSIRKLSYVVLHHVASCKISKEVFFLSEKNRQHWHAILNTMLDGAINIRDAIVQKSCVAFFRMIVEQWTGSDLIRSHKDDLFQELIRVLMETILVNLFKCFLKASFNIHDASDARIIKETCRLLLVLKQSVLSNYEFHDWISSYLFPTFDVNACASGGPIHINAIISSIENANTETELYKVIASLLQDLKDTK